MDDPILSVVIFASVITLVLLILALINDKIKEQNDKKIYKGVSNKKFTLIAGNDPRFSDDRPNNTDVTGL